MVLPHPPDPPKKQVGFYLLAYLRIIGGYLEGSTALERARAQCAAALSFKYSFERLTDVIDRFTEALIQSAPIIAYPKLSDYDEQYVLRTAAPRSRTG